MRNLLFGAIAGLLLSLLRAPLGLDLFQIPAVESRTALGVRALALLVIAGGFLASIRASITPGLLLGATFGYALHGLLLANTYSPWTRLQLVAIAGLGLLLLVSIGKGARHPDSEASDAPPAPNFGELLGLAFAGAGLAIGLELLARHLRLFGTQLAADDSVFGSVLLALIFVGAACFGWITRAARWRQYSLGVALALAAAALFLGLRALRAVVGTAGLRDYTHTYGIDLSQHGMPAYDALLAASFFVAPAFLIGAALRGASGRKRIFALLVGAASGLFFEPGLFDVALDTAAMEKHTFAAQYLPIAALIAVGGAAFALLCLPGKPSVPRWLALVLALACGWPALQSEVAPQIVLAPWSRVPVYPYLTFDAPEGLITVEGPLQAGGTGLLNKQVTLDRRTLVPGIESTRTDLARIDLALGQLPKTPRAGKERAALIIGQLTPLFAQRLTQSGFKRVDRSASWWASMERIEKELFAGTPLPAGERLAPDAAGRRLDAGDYDLVLVPQASGDAPRMRDLDVPPGTLLVVWLDASSLMVQRRLSERVLLCALGLEEPCVALVVHGRAEAESEPLGPQFVRSGEPRTPPTPLTWSSTPERERTDLARQLLFERFDAAAAGTSDAALLDGMAAVYAAQTYSSPFENAEQRFELPQEGLARLRAAALAAKPNAFVAQLWEWLGDVLAEKRWIPQMYENLEPLARAHAPWPKLEHLLARADAESLDFEGSLKRLEALRDGPLQRNPAYWIDMGNDLEQLGRADEAIAAWKRARALQQGNRLLERKLAMALVRKHDPEGVKLIEALLAANPKDEELKSYQGPGPYPEPKRGYEPPH